MMDVYRAFAAGQYPFDGTASRVLAQAFVARNG